MIHFVAPCPESTLDELILLSLDNDYPYWIGGSINWVVQTYLILKNFQTNITIGIKPIPGRINIAHVRTWRKFPKRIGEYRVSIRADYRRLFDVDYEILQNPIAVTNCKQVYIPYWPVPGLIARDTSRCTVRSIAYAGRIGNRNIDLFFQDSGLANRLNNLNFRIIDKKKWHDMREIDILVAIRNFSRSTYSEKPPSKLINAWHSSIPLIAGYDSAFSAIGTPGVDYIRVKKVRELRDALERLRDDPVFYNRIVQAGRKKSQEYTRDKIAQDWLAAIEEPVGNDFAAFKTKGVTHKLLLRCNQFADFVFDSASSTKAMFGS